MNDALFGRVNVEKLNTKLFAVSPERFDLISGDGVSNWQTAIRRWDVVIDSTESEIRASDFATCLAQSIKRLWRRHFVNEVQIDVEEWLAHHALHERRARARVCRIT